MQTNRFAQWLNGELNKRGWSQSELARRAGISRPSITLVLSEKQAPTYDFCAQIAKPLDMRPEDVFRLAGLLRQTRGDDDEITYRKVLDLMRELTPEERQRDRLLDVYLAGRYPVDELNARRGALDAKIANERAARDAITRQIQDVEDGGLCAISDGFRDVLHTVHSISDFADQRRVVVSLGEAGLRFVMSPAPPPEGKKRKRSRMTFVWQGVELDSLVV